MTAAIPLLASLALGYLTLMTVLKGVNRLNGPLTLVLSAGLGIGLNAIITYYGFLLFGGFGRGMIAELTGGAVLVLVGINARTLAAQARNLKWRFSLWSIPAGILWGLALYVIVFMAYRHPYGEWDAWALYNMKMKFLIGSGEHWKDIFTRLHWYTQPDYPLLLPFINVHQFALSQTAQAVVPLITGVVFSMLIVWLLFGALRQVAPAYVAFFASFLLLVNPFYVFQGTSQYADTVLAFYLLASVVCLNLTALHRCRGMATVSGLVMGLMSFTKNEGLVMSILLTGSFGLYLLCRRVPAAQKKQDLLLIPCLLLGYAVTSSATVILKLFLAPANKDIFGGAAGAEMEYLNMNGLTITAQALGKELTHQRWALMWWFVLGLAVLANRRLFYKENKIYLGFFASYLGVLLVIYLTTVNFDLGWRLKSTLPRILFYLLPTVLFAVNWAIHRYRYQPPAEPLPAAQHGEQRDEEQAGPPEEAMIQEPQPEESRESVTR